MNKTLLLFFIALVFQAKAQDLDNFSKLKSAGPIPDFFTKFLDEKIAADDDLLKNDNSISNRNAADFSAITNYKLQQLIQGGKVLYGDPLTVYANGVLDKLKAASDLDLDFVQLYTLKSNEVNAFATHQGVLFITVGLIGQ
jgi:predicted Zn-dependent protease